MSVNPHGAHTNFIIQLLLQHITRGPLPPIISEILTVSYYLTLDLPPALLSTAYR